MFHKKLTNGFPKTSNYFTLPLAKYGSPMLHNLIRTWYFELFKFWTFWCVYGAVVILICI